MLGGATMMDASRRTKVMSEPVAAVLGLGARAEHLARVTGADAGVTAMRATPVPRAGVAGTGGHRLARACEATMTSRNHRAAPAAAQPAGAGGWRSGGSAATPERRPGTGARLAGAPATAGLVGALGVPLLYMLVVDPVVVAGALGGTGRALVSYAVWWSLAGALLAG
jgi:hypothetical protein